MFENSKEIVWKIFLATSIADITGMHHGFSNGFSSPIALEVTTQLHILDSVTFPIFSSITFAGQGIGAIFSIYFYDIIGRKASIVSSSLLAAIGWLMIAMGHSAVVLIIGRAITGLGIGVQLYNTPSYVNDISHYTSKGFYLSFFNFFIRSGVILVYSLGIILSFRYLALCAVGLNILVIIGFTYLPYSPLWLSYKGSNISAKVTLMKLRRNETTVDLEIATLNSIIRNKTNMEFIDKIKLFRQWFYLKILIIGQVYMLCFGFSAIGVFYSYSSIFLSGGTIPPKISSLVLPFFGILGAIMGILLIDRLGRRKLMIIGCIGIVISYASVAVYFTVLNKSIPCLAKPIPSNYTHICNYIPLWPTVSIALFGLAQAFCYGSVGYTFVGELFPVHVKGIISGLGIVPLRISSFTAVLISPYIGTLGSFYSLTVINLLSLLFVILYIPETKGKDAEQIEKMLRERSFFIDSPCCYNKKHKLYTTLQD